ncbi:MAG: hypothetical protein SVT56_12360, partial [Chloroflexota bacterium]|nr:hypothetical protein [Chloroflexota bacterium]
VNADLWGNGPPNPPEGGIKCFSPPFGGQGGLSTPRIHVEPVLKRYTISEVENLVDRFEISDDLEAVVAYLNYRASVIEEKVQALLMDRDKAQKIFEDIHQSYTPTCSLPMNKQKGEKRHYSYLTCIVNMLTEKNLKDKTFDDNPRRLGLITNSDNKLVKTLSRRVDGAYPSILNPVAIWEIKEY